MRALLCRRMCVSLCRQAHAESVCEVHGLLRLSCVTYPAVWNVSLTTQVRACVPSPAQLALLMTRVRLTVDETALPPSPQPSSPASRARMHTPSVAVSLSPQPALGSEGAVPRVLFVVFVMRYHPDVQSHIVISVVFKLCPSLV